MQILIKYKSGEGRKINLHPYFFATNEITRKMPWISDVSVSDRAQQIAYSGGREPYYIGVFRDGVTVYELNIRANQPDIFNPRRKSKEEKIDERQVKKYLRKETKRQPLRKVSFTQINSFA